MKNKLLGLLRIVRKVGGKIFDAVFFVIFIVLYAIFFLPGGVYFLVKRRLGERFSGAGSSWSEVEQVDEFEGQG